MKETQEKSNFSSSAGFWIHFGPKKTWGEEESKWQWLLSTYFVLSTDEVPNQRDQSVYCASAVAKNLQQQHNREVIEPQVVFDLVIFKGLKK